jgi:hypothetical protein
MPSVHELVSEQFHRWEERGRGWQVFDRPVALEPPFIPFAYSLPKPAADDGRRPTLFSSLIQGLSRAVSPKTQSPPLVLEESEAEPQTLQRQPPVELQVLLPRDFDAPRSVFAQLLKSVFPSDEPFCFELLGLPDRSALQLALAPADSLRVRKQIKAFFPDLSVIEGKDMLAKVWDESDDGETLIIEFGLAREFMLPLALTRSDPFVGLAAALDDLQSGELALLQVLFQPVASPWDESITQALNDRDGKPVFVNAPHLTMAGETKVQQPLFAAVVRIATRASEFDRAWAIARDLASGLRVFSNPAGNELIPLLNEGYHPAQHEEDVLLRQTHRSGMILTLDELLGFVHLPSIEVPKLARQLTKTKAAPENLSAGILLGHNTHAGRTVEVRLSAEQRVRHAQIIGASGTGKTTLLFNLIRQDIENGQGLALLDPHGDLVERILGVIPKERIGDVVLVDPADEEYSIGFNILSAHSDLEKQLLASDLVSVFKRLSSSWGDQMGSVLQNAILAFLESNRGGTLLDLRRFLLEPAFRTEFLKSVQDSEVLYYWQKAFPQLTGNKSIGPVLTRLETFLARKQIRYMVGQPINRLDFGEIMDTGKILLAKLSQGLLGNENSYLLGTVLVAKFQQLAMSRQAQWAAARRDFWLYMDEFQNFITPTLAEILTGARKYRMGLVLAHHELRQLEREKEVASAVLSNCYTRIVFRVGDDDAGKLADGFASFEARDLQNLAIGHAIARVERSDFDFNLSIPLPTEPNQDEAAQRREDVITASRKKYGTARSAVEAMLRQGPEPSPKETKATQASLPPKPEQQQREDSPKSFEPPKSSEAPKSTLPEEEAVEAERAKTEAPRDLGRGGAQHKAIQQRIKEAAEKIGFLSVIEKQVSVSPGSVDLVLERDGQVIACEISITTTIDHEVGNISKCLKAGFPKVAVICLDEERLRKIAAAVAGSLGAETSAQVVYYLPDAFIAYLHSLPVAAPKTPETPETRKGYRVKRSAPKLTLEEQKQREDAAIRSIAEAMKRKSK